MKFYYRSEKLAKLYIRSRKTWKMWEIFDILQTYTSIVSVNVSHRSLCKAYAYASSRSICKVTL